MESPEAGSKSLLWRIRFSLKICPGVSLLEPSVLGCRFFPCGSSWWVDYFYNFFFLFASVDTPFSGFKFWPSGWKNFTVITHHKRNWCSAHVPGYLGHYRMRLTICQNHFLSQIWKLYQERFARTLRILTANQQSLWSYFCFGVDSHEDTWRMHSWDVTSWM